MHVSPRYVVSFISSVIVFVYRCMPWPYGGLLNLGCPPAPRVPGFVFPPLPPNTDSIGLYTIIYGFIVGRYRSVYGRYRSVYGRYKVGMGPYGVGMGPYGVGMGPYGVDMGPHGVDMGPAGAFRDLPWPPARSVSKKRNDLPRGCLKKKRIASWRKIVPKPNFP